MKALLKWTAVGLVMLGTGTAMAQERGGRAFDQRSPGAGKPSVAAPHQPVIRTAPVPVLRPAPIVRPGPVGRPHHYPRRPVFVPLVRVPVWTPALPYAARYHDTCQRKAWRLRWFERHATADGYLSASERYEIAALRRDVRRTCGDWRWRD